MWEKDRRVLRELTHIPALFFLTPWTSLKATPKCAVNIEWTLYGHETSAIIMAASSSYEDVDNVWEVLL